MMQVVYENGPLIAATLGAVLVVLSLGQLWLGRRYLDALRDRDWELRQMRASMQQLEDDLASNRTLLTKQLAESSLQLQQVRARVDEGLSLLKDWETAAAACASELEALMKSDKVAESPTVSRTKRKGVRTQESQSPQ
jgi:hypothetical protein